MNETPIRSTENPAAEESGQMQLVFLSVDEACPEPQSESTGHLLVEGRNRLRLTREQAAAASDVLVSYIEMLESGNYRDVSDPLYLLPYLRRYASSLAIDVSDITWRFMRDFQAKENAALDVWKPDSSVDAPLRRLPQFNPRFLIAAAILFGALSAVILYRVHHAHIARSRLASVKPHPIPSPKALPVAATAMEVPSPLASPAVTTHSRVTMNKQVQKRRRPISHRRYRHPQHSSY